MNHIDLINRSIAHSIVAMGDLARHVGVAQPVPQADQPGQDYDPAYNLIGGARGFWDKIDSIDFPGATIETERPRAHVADVQVALPCEHARFRATSTTCHTTCSR
jgi:hypothetical protein